MDEDIKDIYKLIMVFIAGTFKNRRWRHIIFIALKELIEQLTSCVLFILRNMPLVTISHAYNVKKENCLETCYHALELVISNILHNKIVSPTFYLLSVVYFMRTICTHVPNKCNAI